MQDGELCLGDIVEAVDTVRRFVSNVDEEVFLQDELRWSAVFQKLLIIGDTVARLPRR